MMQDYALRIGGLPIGQVVGRYGGWSEPVFTWRYPLGCWEATWKMWLRDGHDHVLSGTAPVEVSIGASQVWAGSLPSVDLAEDDDGSVSVVALGACRDAEGATALNFNDNTCARPQLSARAAVARGAVNWRNVLTLPDVPFVGEASDGDETDHINYLGALLDAYAQEHDQAWGVDGWRDVYLTSDPSVPAYYVRPSVQLLGTTSEATVGRLFGRYISSATGRLATVTAGTGTPEKALDMTALGKMTAAKALGKLESLSRRFGATTGWKNGVTLTPEQITTPGGIAPHLGIVAAQAGRGLMVRLLGQSDPRTPGRDYLDVVVGEAIWTPAEQTLQLNPVDMASDDFSSVLESMGIKDVTQ